MEARGPAGRLPLDRSPRRSPERDLDLFAPQMAHARTPPTRRRLHPPAAPAGRRALLRGLRHPHRAPRAGAGGRALVSQPARSRALTLAAELCARRPRGRSLPPHLGRRARDDRRAHGRLPGRPRRPRAPGRGPARRPPRHALRADLVRPRAALARRRTSSERWPCPQAVTPAALDAALRAAPGARAASWCRPLPRRRARHRRAYRRRAPARRRADRRPDAWRAPALASRAPGRRGRRGRRPGHHPRGRAARARGRGRCSSRAPRRSPGCRRWRWSARSRCARRPRPAVRRRPSQDGRIHAALRSAAPRGPS